MPYLDTVPCKTCGSLRPYPRGNCADCQRQAGARHAAHEKAAPGSHTEAEFHAKAATYTHCPCCNRPWVDVERYGRQTRPYTKGHIIAPRMGGSNDISNIQPECASCNYARHDAHLPALT